MSLGARATKSGAKAAGKDTKPQEKGKTEKPQPKEKVKPQATTEQLRMAHMIDRKSEDASDVRRMVLELMEMTCRTEEEVCSALHDSDNDMVAACNLLLEESQRIQGEWQTNEKKKKKPPAAAGNGETDPPRDPRSRSGPRPRRGEGEGGVRGRGAPRGRGGGRGAARGGRGGRRPGPPRARLSRPEPSWDDNADTGGTGGDAFPTTEDWDNEEWSGSLSDTKVFTPSANAQSAAVDMEPAGVGQEDWDSPETNGPTDSHIPTYTYHNAAHQAPAVSPTVHQHLKLIEQMSTVNSHPHSSSGVVSASATVDTAPMESYHSTPHHQPMGMSGSLTAAQSQYLSQLTQQSQAQRHDSVYAASYGVYGVSGDISSQRKPQRARVPPPSKIPSSAVEMPGGGEGGSAMFLDVQFGALEPDALQEAPPQPTPTPAAPPAPAPVPASQPSVKQMVSQVEPQPAPAPHEPPPDSASNAYPSANSMLNESLSVVDTTPTSQPVATESIVTNSTALEKQLTASMKQLAVSAAEAVSAAASSAAPPSAPTHAAVPAAHAYAQHHRPKTVSGQNVYAHHPVSHHPPVYGANVYAPQVNSTNASLTGASGMAATAYPSSVTLTQYQPMMNSYQQTSSSATVYGGSALYTAAPYTAYQPTKMQAKEAQQYDNSVASSNSLTSTSTTQSSAAKVPTTTVAAAGANAGSTAGNASNAAYAAAGALYGAGGANPTYAAYDEAQMMRSTLPHHMGGYYEVGYGVSGGREGTFGLGAGERFGRTDAASPQQVPAAALPPGYAYFYQPPPTTYQYGVYPTYGGGSNVGGVGGVGGVSGGVSAGGKLSTYAPQQPPYDTQDSYKPGGPYSGSANKTGGGAAADLTNAIYAKTHVALNKVNSYEKAAFHSGTPPPFGAGSHLYIPAPPHHHPHHHAPQQHQMDVRVNSSHNRRQENAAGGGRNATAKPPASKPTYNQSYWAPN